MKHIVFSILFLLTQACESSDHSTQKESSQKQLGFVTVYDPAIHLLGNENEWNLVRNKILFNSAFGAPALLTPAGKRSKGLDAKTVLHTLHSWFTEGAGFVSADYGSYELLILRRIPHTVLLEIYSRMSIEPTGFGLLDVNHWRTIYQLQEKFKIAVLSHYPAAIAGLNIGSQRLIAFDILANSGTLAHELRHQKQYDLLGKKAFWNDIEPVCKEKLSDFFAELDATTAQLREWAGVIRRSKVHVESLSQYLEEGEDTVSPSVMWSLGANLEYPIAHASVVLEKDASDDSLFFQTNCSQNIKRIVSDIRHMVMRQKTKLIASNDARVLKGKLRRETAALLRAKESCDVIQANNGEASAKCTEISDRLLEIEQTVQGSKNNIAKALEEAHAERTQEIPKLFSSLKRGEIKEMCNEVMGIQLMINCGDYR